MISQIRSRVNKWLEARFPVPHPPEGVTLKTQRLMLREMEARDHDAICAYLSDPEVLRHQARTRPYSVEECWNRILYARKQISVNPRGSYSLAVVLVESDQMIGECDLTLLYGAEDAKPTGAATIGFMIQRDLWNRGFAAEAAQGLLRFAFTELGLERVFGGCLEANSSSKHVLEKLGMKYEAVHEDFPGCPPGVEAIVYSTSRSEWTAMNEREAYAE